MSLQLPPYFAEIHAAFPDTVDVEKDTIIVQPEGILGPRFIAGRVLSDQRRIDFNIETEMRGLRHALFERFRASEMAGEAIRHFSAQESVEGIDFAWYSKQTPTRSLNFTQYLAQRNKLRLVLPYEEAKIAAALSTWTMARIALQNGFTRLDEVHEAGSLEEPSKVFGTIWRS